MMRRRRVLQATSALVVLAGCASLTGQEPLRVNVADLQSLDGEGMEVRWLCVLRVQNPNDTDIPFSGVSLDVQVRGGSVASGVADLTGSVPRFGEVLVSVPVTASAVSLARLAFGFFMGDDKSRVDYVVRGRIGSSRFETRGEIPLPGLPGTSPGVAG